MNSIYALKKKLNLEVARLIASFGVISIHVHSNTKRAEYFSLFFGPLCVPFFYATAIIFFVKSLNLYPIKTILIKIWQRIAVPFLFWSLIYVSLLYLKTIITGVPIHSLIWRVFLFAESSVHLYYLVTLIILQLFILSIYILFRIKSRYNFYLVLFLLFSCIVYIYFAIYNQATGFRTIYYFLGYLIYILFAVFYNNVNSNKFLIHPFFYISIILLIITFCFCNLKTNKETITLLVPFSGISIFLLLTTLPSIKLPQRLINVTSMSYGIYLCHIVFLELLELLWKIIFKHEMVYNLIPKVLLTCSVFVFSIVFISIIRKFSILKILLLGENPSSNVNTNAKAIILSN